MQRCAEQRGWNPASPKLAGSVSGGGLEPVFLSAYLTNAKATKVPFLPVVPLFTLCFNYGQAVMLTSTQETKTGGSV